MRFTLLDFETTGLDPQNSELLEVGAIRVLLRPDGTLDEEERFSQLIRPEGEIPWVIQKLTGITPELLQKSKARPLSEVLPEFLDFLGDSPIIAHNASMEQGFLDHQILPLSARNSFEVWNSIEPLALLLPEMSSHSMETLRDWAELSHEGSHRALEDCEALLGLLRFGRDFLIHKRPWISGLVSRYIGTKDDWAWSWYFLDSLPPEVLEASPPEKEPLTDLRELKKRDEARDHEEKRKSSINRSSIEKALRSAAEKLGLEVRPQQLVMSTEVLEALSSGKRLAIEAPTGTGKSLAYLLPGVLRSRETGTPLVVSTHSKSLQDQLFEKDIPKLSAILDSPVHATTVKGQNNYLCLRKLNEVLATVGFTDPLDLRWSATYLAALSYAVPVVELDRISRYLRSEFPALDEWIDRVRSHHTTTLGPPCPYYKQCHFFDSARLAHDAEVIVANHALVFQWPQHLPQIRDLVLDEGHHLEDQLTKTLTVSVSENELSEACDRLARKQGSRKLGDAVGISRLLDNLEWTDFLERTDEVRSRILHVRNAAPMLVPNVDGTEGYEQVVVLQRGSKQRGSETVWKTLEELRSAVQDLNVFLTQTLNRCEGQRASLDIDLLKTHQMRFSAFTEAFNALVSDDANFLRCLYWHPREALWRFDVAPIDTTGLGEPFFSQRHSVVVTSATLSAGTQPHFVTDRVGLKPDKPLIQLPSPYRLAEQAQVYLPTDVGPPGTAGHLDALIHFAEEIAVELGGRTLLLMSSNRRLRTAAETLRDRLKRAQIDVYDSLSDRRAAEGFIGAERAILVGGERYGEGLDIPGPKLSCVIIEKINEAMTRSPLAEARRARTKFGLFDYDFPVRMMWLKQRVGRLIRSPSDQGAIIIFDPRYNGWSASSRQQVDRTLAPMPIQLTSRSEIVEAVSKKYGLGR
ncbi:MAG: DEAD/DEAH box helicase [Bdellovibrionales bacterium]|nr:DEAD/DEAH box helicase [Bdellovibrionales bacterium]